MLNKTFLSAFLMASILPVSAASIYSDVPTSHWAHESLLALSQKYHLTLGDTQGHFNGERKLTRYEMAVILHKALGLLEKKKLSNEDSKTVDKLKHHLETEWIHIQERLEYVEDQVDVQSSLNDDFKHQISQLLSQHQMRPFGSLALRYCGMTTDVFGEPSQILGNNLLGNTFQVRLGAGINGKAFDHFDYQLRVLTTDNNSYNLSWFPFGGTAIPRGLLALDRFFIRYRPFEKTDTNQFHLTVGKSRNIFSESELLFDEDISLTGLDQKWVFKSLFPMLSHMEIGLAQKALLIEETKITSGVLGGKVAARFDINKEFSIRTGGGYLHYLGTDNLAQYNFLQGYQGGWGQRNRGASDKDFTSDFRLLNGFLKLGYTGFSKLPLTVFADVAHNLGASDKNRGAFAGVTLGKLKKQGDWALSYIYKYQEQDYNVSLFVDNTTGGTDTQTHSLDLGTKLGKKTQLSSTLHIRNSLVRPSLAPLLIFYTTLRQDF